MITCPECGLEAPEGAKFCDRCGQGLTASAAPAAPPSSRPPALEPGTVLKERFRINQLAGQDSIENRYLASRTNGAETVRLRERLGPAGEAQSESAPEEKPAPPPEENPAGPHAKTAELKPVNVNGGPPASNRGAASEAAPAAAADVDTEVGEAQVSEAESAEKIPAEPEPQSSTGIDNTAGNGEMAAAAEAEEQIPAETPQPEPEDLGDVFGRVLALSVTLNHPAFEKAESGFANDRRVYLVYPDSKLTSLSRRPGGIRMREPDAIAIAIQVCQAVGFLHRRALRLNDICPESVAIAPDGRIKLTGLDYVSNDNELQTDPVFNDGYTAPEVYRGKKVNKQADVFSIGALLYTLLTGARLEAETWREEAGPVHFYPPHVVSPMLEQVVRRAVLFNPTERWQGVDALKAELLKLSGEVKIRAASMTDVGMVRELNEDSVLALEYFRDSQVEPSQSFLYAVCDGMGGAEAGETASAIAVTTLRDYVEERLRRGETEGLDKMLAAALEEANVNIIEYQKQHPEARGMGSTAVGAVIVPPNGAVAWVGDSRAYLLDGGSLRQITKDHSLVQRLVEIGQITPEEARHHEHKNVITRSLGARQSGPAGAEAFSLKLRRGERLLLCSDGLTTHVEDKDVADIMRRHNDPYDAARELIVAANAGGGTDNISVIVVFAS